MSIYCKHCGEILADDQLFCPTCGMRQADPVPTPKPQEIPKTAPETPPKKKANKKLVIVGSILGSILVIALVLFPLLPNPCAAVDKYEAYVNGDIDSMEDLAPIEYWESLAKENNQAVDKYLRNRIEEYESNYTEQKERWQSAYGKDFEIIIKVVNSSPLKYENEEYIIETLAENYDIGENRIGAMHHLILRITYAGSRGCKSIGGTAVAVQIDSKWYLLRYSRLPIGFSVKFVTSFSPTTLASTSPLGI